MFYYQRWSIEANRLIDLNSFYPYSWQFNIHGYWRGIHVISLWWVFNQINMYLKIGNDSFTWIGGGSFFCTFLNFFWILLIEVFDNLIIGPSRKVWKLFLQWKVLVIPRSLTLASNKWNLVLDGLLSAGSLPWKDQHTKYLLEKEWKKS